MRLSLPCPTHRPRGAAGSVPAPSGRLVCGPPVPRARVLPAFMSGALSLWVGRGWEGAMQACPWPDRWAVRPWQGRLSPPAPSQGHAGAGLPRVCVCSLQLLEQGPTDLGLKPVSGTSSLTRPPGGGTWGPQDCVPLGGWASISFSSSFWACPHPSACPFPGVPRPLWQDQCVPCRRQRPSLCLPPALLRALELAMAPGLVQESPSGAPWLEGPGRVPTPLSV